MNVEWNTCVWCSHCYQIDGLFLCCALGTTRFTQPDQIEWPFTDTRPCKMYEDREF